MAQDPLEIPQDPSPEAAHTFEWPDVPTTEEVMGLRHAEALRRAEVAETGVTDLLSSAVKETWAFSPIFADAHHINWKLDPAFYPSEEDRHKIKTQLPSSAWSDALSANNPAHLAEIFHDVQSRQRTQSILHEKYPIATPLTTFAAAFLDPVNIAMMVTTGPVFANIAKSGKYGVEAWEVPLLLCLASMLQRLQTRQMLLSLHRMEQRSANGVSRRLVEVRSVGGALHF